MRLIAEIGKDEQKQLDFFESLGYTIWQLCPSQLAEFLDPEAPWKKI